MAKLEILEFPDSRLRTVAKPVEAFDEGLRRLVADMFETMYDAPGIGLAASQVDVHKRLLVADVSDDKTQPVCLINPQIVAKEGSQTCEEGCLSVPGITANVERAAWIRVKALDAHGEPFECTAEGLLAVCVQHEMDHLDGKLFVDYLSPLKQQRVRKKLSKQRRAEPERAGGPAI